MSFSISPYIRHLGLYDPDVPDIVAMTRRYAPLYAMVNRALAVQTVAFETAPVSNGPQSRGHDNAKGLFFPAQARRCWHLALLARLG
jgi:hypothetical protein